MHCITEMSTTAVEQYVRTNPQRQHSSTAVRTTAVHLWYARSSVGFALTYNYPPSGGKREPSPTKHPPPTTHPPSTHHPPPTHRPTHHHSSTTAVEQYVPTNPQRQHSTYYAMSWVAFALSYDSPPFGGERQPSPVEAFHAPR